MNHPEQLPDHQHDNGHAHTTEALARLRDQAHDATTAHVEHHGIDERRKQELFDEQQEGYNASRRIASIKAIDFRGETPIVKLVTLQDLVDAYGRGAVEKALAGGPEMLLCSDDRVVAPEGWVKVGLPGSGALVPAEQRPAFFQHLKSAHDIKAVTYHEQCGACKANFELATEVGKEAHAALGKDLPLQVSGYTEGNVDFKMTGDPSFHEGLGFVITGQPQFNTAALGMERHMHITSKAFEDDAELNRQVQALIGILMGHGWGPDAFRQHKLQFKIVGNPGDPQNSAQRLVQRLAPTWTMLKKQYPDTFEAVAFDVQH